LEMMEERKVSSSKITILIPTYNAKRYVVKCLDSIRTQTVPPAF